MGKSKPLVAGGTEVSHTTIATDPGLARTANNKASVREIRMYEEEIDCIDKAGVASVDSSTTGVSVSCDK